MQAALLAVLADQRKTMSIGVGRRVDLDGSASHRDFAAAPAARDAEDGFQDLGATGTEQAADAQDFALAELKIDTVQRPLPAPAGEGVEGKIAHREHDRAALRLAFAVLHGHV